MLQKASLALNAVLFLFLIICLFTTNEKIVEVQMPASVVIKESPAPKQHEETKQQSVAKNEIVTSKTITSPVAPQTSQKTVLYQTTTDDQRYTIKLVSDNHISLNGRQIDEKTVVFDNLIMTGTVNHESPFRMVYLLQVTDHTSGLMLVISDEDGKEAEIFPSFLYSMRETGYYTIELFTTPAMATNLQLVQKTEQTTGLDSGAIPLLLNPR